MLIIQIARSLLDTTNLKDSNQPTNLAKPINMASDRPELVLGVSRVKGAGNTYEVVNIDKPNIEEIEAQASVITLDEFLKLTYDEDPITRRKALRELCPCHVKHNVEEFWNRIIAMTNDPDSIFS